MESCGDPDYVVARREACSGLLESPFEGKPVQRTTVKPRNITYPCFLLSQVRDSVSKLNKVVLCTYCFIAIFIFVQITIFMAMTTIAIKIVYLALVFAGLWVVS